MTDRLGLARGFMAGHGRVLDRRRFELLLDDGDPEPVLDALAAYRNPDGGYGHGLEPDLRSRRARGEAEARGARSREQRPALADVPHPLPPKARLTARQGRRRPGVTSTTAGGTSARRPCGCDGARRTRTADLLGAIQALSQLSYSPARGEV